MIKKKETISSDKGSVERTIDHIILSGKILSVFHLRSETRQGNSLTFNINMEMLICMEKQ